MMIVREAVPTDAPAIAKAHIDTWRSTYRGMISDEILDNLDYATREARWDQTLTTGRDRNHTYVVEDDAGQVVGFGSGGIERDEQSGSVGEIYALYLLKEHQGKGWGKRLFLETAGRLKREGYQSLLLWVLVDNPTRAFYEAMGGKPTKQKEIEIGGNMLVEVAYEWDEIPS